jgi:hypothetical protein
MIRDARQASGLFLALLALVARLLLPAAMPTAAASLADVTVLCQHGGNPDAPPAPIHHTPAHHIPDGQLCFVCHGVTGPIGMLTAVLMPPEPMTPPVARVTALPPAREPPFRIVTAAHPRGPPILV